MADESQWTWWRIVAPHFVAALAVNTSGIVVESAPILRWTRGSPWSGVRARMVRYGWHGDLL